PYAPGRFGGSVGSDTGAPVAQPPGAVRRLPRAATADLDPARAERLYRLHEVPSSAQEPPRPQCKPRVMRNDRPVRCAPLAPPTKVHAIRFRTPRLPTRERLAARRATRTGRCEAVYLAAPGA